MSRETKTLEAMKTVNEYFTELQLLGKPGYKIYKDYKKITGSTIQYTTFLNMDFMILWNLVYYKK